MLESQGVRFGSHSVNHYIFSTLSEEQARYQIQNAYPRLRAELAAPLSVFCYPVGCRRDYTGRELRLLSDFGHTSAVSMLPGVAQRHTVGHFLPRFDINRYGMPGTLEEFAKYVSWVERVQDRIRCRSPRALVTDRYGSPRGLLSAWTAMTDHRLGRLEIPRHIEWEKVKRLVFVCLGNVCRSPFAEAVALHHGLQALSYGLQTDGRTPANAVASRVALEMGVDITRHESRMFQADDLRPGDLVIGMEPAHLKDPRLRNTPVDVQVSLLGLLDPKRPKPYIHDPYGSSDAYFEHCLAEIRSTVEHIACRLKASSGRS
jgi:protein-tyrosine phosphatase